jgi:DNA repair protein RecO (recombination protein O)
MGGVVCGECENLSKNIIKISPGTLETIRILLNTEISRLNTVKMDNTIFNEVDKLVKRFVETHLDKHFKSLDFLNEIKNNNIK